MASASFEPDRQPESGNLDKMKWLCQSLRHHCIGRRVVHLIDDADPAVPLFHTHDLDLIASRRLLAEKDPNDEADQRGATPPPRVSVRVRLIGSLRAAPPQTTPCAA